MLLTQVPCDVILHVLHHLKANDVQTLILVCNDLKNLILLNKYKYQKFLAKYLPRVRPYLFNLDCHSYPWIVDRSRLRKRLEILVGKFSDLLYIENSCLAGGSVLQILDTTVSDEELEKGTTDLDFFIFKKKLRDLQQETEAFLTILDPFCPYYFTRGNVLEVLIPNERRIQLVFSPNANAYGIVGNFDFNYCQFFVEQGKFHGTHLAMAALANREAVPMSNTIVRDRLVKAEKKGFKVLLNDAVRIVDPAHTNVRNRFLLSCVKNELDKGERDLAILKTFSRKIQIEELLADMSPWKTFRYGAVDIAKVPYFRNVSLDTITAQMWKPKSSSHNLEEFRVMSEDSELVVQSPVLKVVGNPNVDDIFGHGIGRGAFPEKNRLFVHKGPFSDFYKDLKISLQRTDGHIFKHSDHYEDDTWLPLKIKNGTEIVDMLDVPYREPIKPNDNIICESAFRDYQYLLRRRRGERKEEGFLTVVAEKIIVLPKNTVVFS